MIDFVSLKNREPLLKKDEFYVSLDEKIKYPIVNGIPRFIKIDNYAKSFGLQWNKFRKTQLDSFTKTNLSHDRLKRICGGDLSVFNNKNVLEIGCGAGRFTEIFIANKAHIHAVDLSNAVEANYQNFKDQNNYCVCQANVYDLPFKEDSFDYVCCIGVVQHTPDPERTIETLAKYVKKGGMLLIDHYDRNYPYSLSRKIFRNFFLKLPSKLSFFLTKAMVTILWPLHKLFWKISLTYTKSNRGGRIRKAFIKASPVVDYHDVYTDLNAKQLYEWAILDTHDTLTDFFKHLRNKEEIKKALSNAKMKDINVWIGGNGVEANSIKI